MIKKLQAQQISHRSRYILKYWSLQVLSNPTSTLKSPPGAARAAALAAKHLLESKLLEPGHRRGKPSHISNPTSTLKSPPGAARAAALAAKHLLASKLLEPGHRRGKPSHMSLQV